MCEAALINHDDGDSQEKKNLTGDDNGTKGIRKL